MGGWHKRGQPEKRVENSSLAFFVLPFFPGRGLGGVRVRRLRGARKASGRGGGCSRPRSLRTSGLRSNIQFQQHTVLT